MSITVTNISKRYGKQLALSSVSLSIGKGEIVGFLGPNGAGKSTLMKILTGYLPADSGEASINGLKVDCENTLFRSQIGYLPEHNPLYPEMYIREYLSLTAGFYSLKNKKERVDEVIEMTGLLPEVRKKIGALSKGYRQRVGLAQALVHNPSVLILDEPTSGLDPNQLDEVRGLIARISSDKTVMLSTHIMQEVEAMCNRVIIISKGEIVTDGATADIKKLSVNGAQKVLMATANPLDIKELEALSFVSDVEKTGHNEVLITAIDKHDIRPQLFKTAVDNGWILITLSEQSRSVENIFMELTR